jgi:hypothetical protein
MCKFPFIATLLCLVISAPQHTLAQPNTLADRPVSGDQICSAIESAARASDLPIDFFVRLIWQESRFHSNEVGPLTRTGEHALGIAQFMPGTAIEHGLFEPFNPALALPKSAEFLSELRNEFGNLGLAAAAYNAGPQRIRDYMAGLRDLPDETRNYVWTITGYSVEHWADLAKNNHDLTIGNQPLTWKGPEKTSCSETLVLLARTAYQSSANAEVNVPRWCRSLQHPNVGVCGPVHERLSSMSVQPSSRSLLRLAGHLNLRPSAMPLHDTAGNPRTRK